MAVDHLPTWFAVCLKRLRETAPDSMNEEQFRELVVWFRDSVRWSIHAASLPSRPKDLVTISEAAKQTGIPRRRIEWRADAGHLPSWSGEVGKTVGVFSASAPVLVSLADVRKQFEEAIAERERQVSESLSFNRSAPPPPPPPPPPRDDGFSQPYRTR